MSRSAASPQTRHMICGRLVALALALLALGSLTSQAAPLIIDDFEYTSDAEAQAAWLPRGTSPKVTMGDVGPWGSERVMTLPCNFSSTTDRCYWDRAVNMDLSDQPMIALELFVPDPEAVGQFTLYFQSGGGWYSLSQDITRAGWQTLVLATHDFNVSGSPAGWQQIDTIRLSPWRQADTGIDTELAVRELRGDAPVVFMLRDDAASNQTRVTKATADLAYMLGEFDLSLGEFPPSAVDAGHHLESRLVLLPYNEVITPSQMSAIEYFVATGGRLMVHEQLPPRLEDLLGFEAVGSATGGFSAYDFEDPVIPHLPPRVRHGNWTITLAEPRETLNARVIAEWEDNDGVATGYAAWLASDTGTYMSTYIRNDDRVNKQKMLLGLIGHYVPEIWPPAASAAIRRIGLVAEYASFEEAVNDISERGASTPRSAQIESALADAETARTQAMSEEGAGQYPEAVWTAIAAREHLQRAYALSQTSALPEFRAVWEHSALGPYPGDWVAGIAPLVDNGFSAVFPNSLRAGLAHYPSALLPQSSQFRTYGDQIQQVVDAAHARGIEAHIWKMNWNLERSPQDFIDQMAAEDRLQVSAFGQSINWLCPSHPDNHALEHDSMLEVLQNYEVEGLHFDYIRYPGPDYCYCEGCRTRFEDETGNTVDNWPSDVRNGGPLEPEFEDWRRLQITELVEAVFSSAKALDPAVKISAAVYGDYDKAFDSVGQDWVDWIDRGIVDMLFPMDTTSDYDEFRQLVSEQLAYADGRIPIYPGVGVRNDKTQLSSDAAIRQVLITREFGTGGFIIFSYDKDLAQIILPAFGLGTTLPGSAGETPDGLFVPGLPLTLTRPAAGTLELSWGETCDPSAIVGEYAIYRGSLAAAPDWTWNHDAVTCQTGGATMAAIADEAGSHYFLVVPTDTNREGGYGFDSEGVPRPAAATPCHAQALAPCP